MLRSSNPSAVPDDRCALRVTENCRALEWKQTVEAQPDKKRQIEKGLIGWKLKGHENTSKYLFFIHKYI